MAEGILTSPGVLTNETELSSIASAVTNNQLNSNSKKNKGLLDLLLKNRTKLSLLGNDLSTQYPSTATGTPTVNQPYGGPLDPFIQRYDENNTYLNSNTNVLENSLDISGLDVENPGPQPDITTQYPSTVTGTPTSTQNPGGPAHNFVPPYGPDHSYLGNIGSGFLQNTLDITNFDIENPSVNGGPNSDIVTQYPSTTTGTPNATANWGLFPPFSSGATPKRFTHPYGVNSKYLVLNPIATLNSGKLYQTLNITNLDIDNPNVLGGPLQDTLTTYPVLATGTPTTQSNFSLTSPFTSGTPAKHFSHPWTSTLTYLASNPIAISSSGKLKDTLNITNFDVENPGVNGGPLNDVTTVYPAANVTHTSPIKGWFAEPSEPPSNYKQVFTPANTYESFIQPYI
jgi:hypothetical protein